MEYRRKLFREIENLLANRPRQDKLIDWLMASCVAEENLRVQLLRFIDVFPALKTNRDITKEFLAYVGPQKSGLPKIIRKFFWILNLPFAHCFTGPVIRRMVNLFAKRFIVNGAEKDAVGNIGKSLRSRGLDITWDLLGEEVLTEGEAEVFKNRYLRLIEELGSIPLENRFSHNISIKLSSLVPKISWDPINWEECADKVTLLFTELLRAGMKHNVAINVDMEQYAVRDLTLKIFKQALDQKEFDRLKEAGIVVQAYLRDSEKSLESLLNWIRIRQIPVAIRLVKGAYWDYETIVAQEQGWTVPVFSEKFQTDRQFRKLAKKIMLWQKFCPTINFACASHNVNDIAYTMEVLAKLGLDPARNEFQVLYGMGNQIREAILKTGHRVRVYAPCGEPVAGMAYLVRRLLENTSQQSFLGLTFLKPIQRARSKKEAK